MKVIRRGEIFDGYPYRCLRETGAFIALDLPDALEYRNMVIQTSFVLLKLLKE